MLRAEHPVLSVPENTVVMDVGGERLVVDPGPLDDGTVASLCRAGRVTVLVTHWHWDHVLSAGRLAERCRAAVYAPREALEVLSNPPRVLEWVERVLAVAGAAADEFGALGRVLEDLYRRASASAGAARPLEELGLELVRAVPCPGHVEGHTCYLVGGVLAAGDAVTTPTTPAVADLDAYLETLSRIARLRWRLLVPGHGEPLDRDRGLEVLESIRRRKIRRLLKLLSVLIERGSLTSRDAVKEVYGEPASPAELFVRAYSMLGYITYLERRGLVVVERDATPWRLVPAEREVLMQARSQLTSGL